MLRVWLPNALWCAAVVGCVDLTVPPNLLATESTDGPQPTPDGTAGSPDLAGPSLANGRPCAGGGQCLSGHCVRGRCCEERCVGPCQACNLEGSEGRCTPVPAGQDPHSECPQDPPASCGRDGTCDGRGQCGRYVPGTQCEPGSCTGSIERASSTCDSRGRCTPGASRSCAPNVCKNDSCATACASSSACQNGFFCDQGLCALRRATGAACGQDEQCAAGFCVDGVCCGSRCGEPCYACNLGGSPGVCSPVPAGSDPRDVCSGEAAAGCGRDGTCDGRGRCRLHAAGTVCVPGSCTGVTRRNEGTCNGIGTCVAGATTDCSPYGCGGGADSTCVSSCSSSAQCAPGNVCRGGLCAAADLGLYWKLDEPSGAMAADSSGNGRNGTYAGAHGTPAPSTSVPPVSFPDPASRAFTRANRHAVVLAGAPSDLRPTGALTVSVWFRATSADAIGSDVVGLGGDYFLRIKTNEIEWVKRVAAVSPVFAVCQFLSSSHLDGQWHHLAGVNGPGGMRAYLDGNERCTRADERPILYTGSDVVVGRNGAGHPEFDFQGNVDEVRLYTRTLGAAEIRALASGGL